MYELLPDGEELRRAVKWVSGNIIEKPERQIHLFVHEAIFKFNLSPNDAEFLIRFYSNKSA